MAMIPCPECRRDVSDMAAACPGCGHPVRRAVPVRPPDPEPRPRRRPPPAPRASSGCLLPIFCFCAVLAVGLGIFAAVTKPSEAEMHRVVVGDRPEAVLVAGAAEAAGLMTFSYPDYVVYRKMQVKVPGMPPRTVAVGYLGRVYATDGGGNPNRPAGVEAARPRPDNPAERPLPVPGARADDALHWVTAGLSPFAITNGYYVLLQNSSRTAALEDVTVEYRAADGQTATQVVGTIGPGERKRIDPSAVPWRVERGESFHVTARGRTGILFSVNALLDR